MSPPIIEKKRVLLLAVCALATGVAPVACSESDDNAPAVENTPYDAAMSGTVDSPYDYDVHTEGNVLIPYDAYVDSDVDDAADADVLDANDDGG